jgi:RHS repeat-associated core domain protein
MNGQILEETQPGLNPEGYVSIPFLFQGQYYDYETGLAYNRFRYYDPELGRYISEDPIRFASGTLALHSYVEDVNSWVDVLGLSSYKKSSKSLLKEAELPRKGRMRFILSKNDLLRGNCLLKKLATRRGM